MKVIQDKINKLIERKDYRFKDIEHFNDVIDIEYSKKNIKSLKHTIFNLLPLKKQGTNNHILNIENFSKYLKVKDNKIIIEDNNNTFLKEKDNKKVLKYYGKMNYIDYKNIDKIKVFITFTNPTQYHYYKTNKKGKLIKNVNCKCDNLGMVIDNSFINMNLILRAYYKEVKKVLKRKGLDTDFNFVSVLENHKNLSIHSHNIYYMTKEQIEIFKHCYKLIKKRYKLKQCKFLILKTSKGSSYLMKYLIKDNESEFYKKYRSFYSKYRFFKCSNISKYSQKVLDITYQYLKSNHSDLLKKYDIKEYEKVGNLEDIDIDIKNENVNLNQVEKYFKYKVEEKVFIDSGDITYKPILSIVEDYIDENFTINYTEKPIEIYNWNEIKKDIDKYYKELYSSNLFNLDTIEEIIKEKYSHISKKITDKIGYKNYYINEVESITDKNNNIIYQKSKYIRDEKILEDFRLC